MHRAWTRRVLLALASAVVTVGLGVVINLVVVDGRLIWYNFALAVAAALVAGAVATLSGAGSPNADTSAADLAATRLTREVRLQWEREAMNRGLSVPYPLEIPLEYTRRQIAAEPAEVLGRGRGRMPSPGDVTELARLLHRLPFRRLVILGARESGKTSAIVLLICQLLSRAADGAPVPVLFSLARWDPRQPFDAWLVAEMVGQYSEVLGRGSAGEVAQQLVDDGRILPVLDSMDEMSSQLRGAALKALSDEPWGRPMVVACATHEYEDAVATNGLALPRAAVVELQPITGPLAARYLPAGQLDGTARWAGVVANLRSVQNGVLARALSTPLMVYLARTVYAAFETEPNELLGFTDPPDIKHHLLNAYLPALYEREQRRSARPRRLSRNYPVERVRTWLRFLARHVEDSGTPDLAWWRLETATSLAGRLWVAIVAFCLVCGVVPVLAIGYLLSGAQVGIVLIGGGLLGVMVGTQVTDNPSGGLTGTPPTSDLRQLRAFLRLWGLGVYLTLAIAVVTALITNLLIVGQQFPWPVSAQARLSSFTLVGILLGGWLFGIDAIRRRAQHRIDGRRSPTTAIRLLAVDRRVTLWEGLLVAGTTGSLVAVFAVALAETTGHPTSQALLRGYVVGLGYGATYALLARAWGRWLLFVRIPLAVTRRQPTRIIAFLDDANRRGVLRQEGAIYQFRHSHVSEFLVSRESGCVI